MNVLPNNILVRMSPADRKQLGKAGLTAAECAEKAAVKNERELQKLIANELLRNGIYYTQSATHKRTTNALGTPDFIFCVKGQYCAVEVKHGNGKVRPEQSFALSEIRLNGGRAEVVHSFQEFASFLKGVQA